MAALNFSLLSKTLTPKSPNPISKPSSFIKDGDRLPRIILREPTGSTAEVLLYGGQVVCWKNERREEILFMSSKAVKKPPKPIIGGMPICFPQVANFGTLEQHGFARNRLWALDKDPSPLTPARLILY